MTQASILMSEYVVKGEAPPVVQVGDTVQFNSKAFKLSVDATAEDLLTKLPGVSVDNNTVTAQGETVTQIFVDGKRFFADDHSARKHRRQLQSVASDDGEPGPETVFHT